MEIHLSKDARDWFHQEMEVEAGEAVRFFVRYGGDGLQPGFSLGVMLLFYSLKFGLRLTSLFN